MITYELADLEGRVQICYGEAREWLYNEREDKDVFNTTTELEFMENDAMEYKRPSRRQGRFRELIVTHSPSPESEA